MRSDGIVSFFFIEHEDSKGQWTTSALDHFLFDELPFDDKRGEVGDRYRALLEPQTASSNLWQKFGIHGYKRLPDAIATMKAMSERHPGRKFRIAGRTISQITEVIDVGL